MSARSVLCLLVVLTCYLDNPVLAGIGDPCTTSDECRAVNDTACVNAVCTCVSGFVSGVSQCLRTVGHGELCSESIQCQGLGLAECVSNTCQCSSSFIFNGARCVGNITLGQPCDRDAQCSVPGDLRQITVWCSGGQCNCRRGYRREGERCVIGGDCAVESDCQHLNNSFCDTRPRDRFQCACIAAHIPVGNNTRCLPTVNILGGGCEFTEQCSRDLGNVTCINNQCACTPGTTLQTDNTCASRAGCSTDNDCILIENSFCDNEKCACIDGFIPDGNFTTCTRSAAVGNVLSLSCFLLVWMVKLL